MTVAVGDQLMDCLTDKADGEFGNRCFLALATAIMFPIGTNEHITNSIIVLYTQF
ncbi:hypothetical protein GS458_3372 [Geobacillus stearothermophilus]|nr:hypothetical protein GS458_3372 [Geobacillus stearothermophilus]